jgi:hypothetical protein
VPERVWHSLTVTQKAQGTKQPGMKRATAVRSSSQLLALSKAVLFLHSNVQINPLKTSFVCFLFTPGPSLLSFNPSNHPRSRAWRFTTTLMNLQGEEWLHSN